VNVTDLYAADTPDLIAGPHGQVLRAYADHPEFDAPIELDLEAATVTLDEQRAPRVVAQLTVTTPSDAALALLDPRTGVRVILEAGYVRPGGDEDATPVFDLGLRKIRSARPGDTTTLELASDEALVIDASPSVSASVSSSSTTGAIVALLRQCISPYPRTVVTSSTGPAVNLALVPDRWGGVADLADRIGARVFDDGTRTWRITPDTVVADPAHTLTVGDGGTVTASSDSTDRDSWANYVAHRYRWRTAGASSDSEVYATAYAKAGPYAVDGPAGKRISLDERTTPTTQADANAAAAAVLGRQLTRSRELPLTAVAAWWLRPGDTIRVQRKPAAAASTEVVSALTFRMPGGLMDVTTRLLDPPGTNVIDTTTPVPTSGATVPVADPPPPAKQQYRSSWQANGSATYKGSGAKRTDLLDEVAQGYYGSTNGNQSAVMTFTAANSTGDETGVSISTALAGATVSRVEVWLYATHWFSYAGGTARIGYANATAVPSTFSSAKPYVTASGWKRDTGRWVTITSAALAKALVAGTCRALTVGPGIGTSSTYYGRFVSASGTASRRPVIRITYSK
jgi:hypothetical protein